MVKTLVKDLTSEIRSNLSQVSSSAKDEERVMRAMLNDRDYKVGIYDKDGKVGEYCPAQDARSMIASVIQSTTKVSSEEAAKLAEGHDFKKSESQTMVDLSKEFVNTFIQTGRKLPLGGRELSDVSLSLKKVDEAVRSYPMRIGVKADGTPEYGKGEAKVAPHESVRVHSSCPDWIK